MREGSKLESELSSESLTGEAKEELVASLRKRIEDLGETMENYQKDSSRDDGRILAALKEELRWTENNVSPLAQKELRLLQSGISDVQLEARRALLDPEVYLYVESLKEEEARLERGETPETMEKFRSWFLEITTHERPRPLPVQVRRSMGQFSPENFNELREKTEIALDQGEKEKRIGELMLEIKEAEKAPGERRDQQLGRLHMELEGVKKNRSPLAQAEIAFLRDEVDYLKRTSASTERDEQMKCFRKELKELETGKPARQVEEFKTWWREVESGKK